MAGEFGDAPFGDAPFGGEDVVVDSGGVGRMVAAGVPLTVRIVTARSDRHIKADLMDLTFRSTVPGGFASATMTLSRPLRFQPDEVALYAPVYIYDERNGQTVWEGRLEDPGRGAGSQGEIYEIAAVGSAAHARDTTAMYIIMDTSVERWSRSSAYSTRTADATQDERDDDNPSLFMRAQEGISVFDGWTADMIYKTIMYAHQEIARLSCTVINGGATSLWKNRLVTRLDSGVGTVVDEIDWVATDTNMAGAKGSGAVPIPAGHNVANIRIQRAPSAGTATGNSWGEFINVAVKAVLKNADGTDITSGYTVGWTYASTVVNDLLGRFLDKYDGANASVEATTFEMNQAAWPDGVTPADVLDDLMEFEPGFYWVAWETNPATGLWRFQWRSWPQTIRYEADAVDGLTSSGSASELYNQVRVRYRTPRGYTHFQTRTSTVAVLDAADLTRTALIDLSDETGSVAAQAARAGDEYLAEHATPPNAGQLTITRPILDRDLNRMVQPWEIRPGHLIRVRGIQPHRDSLNLTTRDGVTVFKVIGVDFNASSASATLELDSHPASVARRLAQLGKRKFTRRR